MFNKWISRAEEASLPDFQNHEEAREYFIEKYGNDFVFTSAEKIGSQMCYFYHLIIDHETYKMTMKTLKEGLPVQGGSEILSCYQPIEIFANGNVHIVH